MKTFLMLCIIFISFFSAQAQDAEVLEYINSYKIDKGKLHKQVKLKIKINNRDGNDLSRVSISFQDKNPIYKIKGGIYDIEGKRIRKLKKKDIKELNDTDADILYSDRKVKKFSLRHNSYPYIVSFEYQQTQTEFLNIAAFTPIYSLSAPTRRAELSLQIPENYAITYNNHKIDKPITDTLNNYINYKWKASYLIPLQSQVYSAPLTELVPYAVINPAEFHYGVKGKNTDWKSFGKWIYNLNKGLQNLSEEEKQKLDKLLEGAESKKESVKKLYYYLQDNTRYINVAIDLGGLKTYPATYVCSNKYGDCKALSNYMQAILRYAGIESFYSLINAGQKIEQTDTGFVNQQFNHVILAVPVKNDTIWLECTSNNNPAGYLGTFTQNRFALLTDSTEAKLVKTPALSHEDVHSVSSYYFNFSEDGIREVNVKSRLKGADFERLTSYQDNYNSRINRMILQNEFPFKNYELKYYKTDRPHKDSAYIVLSANLKLNHYSKKFEDIILAKLPQTDIPDFESAEKRYLPVRIDYPVNRTDSFIYTVPTIYKPLELENYTISEKYGQCKIRFCQKNQTLIIIRNLLINAGEYQLDEYPDFYNFIQKVKQVNKDYQIVFKEINLSENPKN